MNRITVKAYGKLNLGLEILGRDERGYHDLRMVMQSVGVYDLLTITEEGQGLRLTCDDPGVPADETNLVLKCARKLLEETGRPQTGLTFHLEKHLPMEAGMAGGSADGAAALAGLNALLKLNLSQQQLCDIGVQLGADIPFCLTGGTQLVEGIGEKLTPLPEYTAGAFLIGKPIAGVSTKAAFAAYDALEEKPRLGEEFERLLEGVKQNDPVETAAHLINALEPVCGMPEVELLGQRMLKAGALGARMTGSGSAVYGIFPTLKEAQEQLESVSHLPFSAAVRPVNRGVEILPQENDKIE